MAYLHFNYVIQSYLQLFVTEIQTKNSGGSILSDSQYAYDGIIVAEKRSRIHKHYNSPRLRFSTIETNGFTMGYYADGSRMWKKIGSGAPTFFLNTGGAIPDCEFDSSGNITAVHNTGANGLLSTASKNSSGWFSTYYAFDFRGNTVNLLGSSGTVYANTTYKAYNSRNADYTYGPGFDGMGGQFGYYRDSDSLYLCGQRYYSPTEGRWLSRDPIGYSGGINLYSYAGNNPINAVDPSGLEPNWWAIAGGFAFGAAVIASGGTIGLAAGVAIVATGVLSWQMADSNSNIIGNTATTATVVTPFVIAAPALEEVGVGEIGGLRLPSASSRISSEGPSSSILNPPHSENSDICFLVSDLLHNVPKHMLIDDTSDLDAFFIKIELAAYLAECRRVNVQPDDRFIALAGKLHEALPLHVRNKIKIPV